MNRFQINNPQINVHSNELFPCEKVQMKWSQLSQYKHLQLYTVFLKRQFTPHGHYRKTKNIKMNWFATFLVC